MRTAPRLLAVGLVRVLFVLAAMLVGNAARTDAATSQGYLLQPITASTVNPTFLVEGLSFDAGTGAADAVHVWAFPGDGSSPVFLAAITTFTSHPRCNGAHPACKFTATVSGLTAGMTYTVVPYVHLVASNSFADLVDPSSLNAARVIATIQAASVDPATVTVSSPTAGGAASGGAAVAYDDKHDVFLVAWESGGDVLARFIGFDGSPRGTAFSVATSRLTTAGSPHVTYSRGTEDDAFFVLYVSDAAASGTGENVFAQVVRFTGSGSTGGTLVGSAVDVSPHSHDATVHQSAGGVVFNPIGRRFLASWTDVYPQGPLLPIPDPPGPPTAVLVRHFGVDGTPSPNPVEVTDPARMYCGFFPYKNVASGVGFDWEHDRYLATFSAVVATSRQPNCSVDSWGQFVVLDGTTLARQQSGSFCHTVFECMRTASVTYSAEAGGFLVGWDRGNANDGGLFNWNAAVSLVTPATAAAGYALDVGTASDDTWSAVAYDADSGRGVGAALSSPIPFVPTPLSDHDDVLAALLDSLGTPLTGTIEIAVTPLSCASCSAGRTDLVAARNGVFGVVYTDANGATLTRITVPAGTPGRHFSHVVATLEGPTRALAPGVGFTVVGWAIDFGASSGTGIDAVHAWAFPTNGGAPIFLGATQSFTGRSDVAGVYGQRFTPSGFQIAAAGLPAGTYAIAAYAHSALTGQFTSTPPSTVTVAPPASNPRLSLDIPASKTTTMPGFDVGGWAIDLGAPEGSGGGIDVMHVYAFAADGSATFLGVAPVNRPRPDVASVYGTQFNNSGFRLTTPALAPGPYHVVVYAHSTVTNTFVDARAADITVRAAGDPVMTIDTPVDGASVNQPFLLAGWAIDRDATSNAGVDAIHVWALPAGGGSPIFVGVGDLNFARPDVGGIYGAQFTNSGYNVSVNGLPPGRYLLVVYAHSAVTGTFNQSRVVTISVH